MKKQAGFSLIELVVAMAVLALIMGAMVHLFGGSVTSLHTGVRQEVVYEEARLLMNELKTTLRYADKDSIDPEQPTVSTNKFSYKGNLWDRHMDIAQGTNKEYKVTVEWKDDTKKQLQVTREDITDGSKKITVFPNDSNNSIFKGKFPVTSEKLTLNDGNTVIMYKIALPLQYEFNGQMKTQTLETKVVPSKDEDNETIEEKLMREYREVLNVGIKVKYKETLSASEEKLKDDFMVNYYDAYGIKYYNKDFVMSNNANICEYLHLVRYKGTWPTADFNGTKIYLEPCSHGKDGKGDFTSEDIFIVGLNNNEYSGWYVNYAYNPDNKKWYYTKNGASVNKSLSEVKKLLNSSNWQLIEKS